MYQQQNNTQKFRVIMNQVDELVSMSVRLRMNENNYCKVIANIEGRLVELTNNEKMNLTHKNQSFSIISNNGQLQSVIKLQVIYEALTMENNTNNLQVTTNTHLIDTLSTYNAPNTFCMETSVCHPTFLKPHFQCFVFHSCLSCKRLVLTGKLNKQGCCQREKCNQYVVVYRRNQYNASYCFDTHLTVLHDLYGDEICYSCGKSGLHVSDQFVNFLTCD